MSLKVVEGQLEAWRMIADSWRTDDGMNVAMFKEFVSRVEKQQSLAPDVLPRNVQVKPWIDWPTGNLLRKNA